MFLSNDIFLLLSLIILAIFILRNKIVDLIFDIFTIEIETKIISYISAAAMTILMVVGIFFNQGPGTLSTSFNNLEPSTNKKPHRYFDIQTDPKDSFKY